MPTAGWALVLWPATSDCPNVARVNMNATTHLSSADLTTPLLSPEILSSFEALSDGRCSLSELNSSVLDACKDDPMATAGVLLLLEGYANSGELDQYDFRPLKRELERHQEIDDPARDAHTADQLTSGEIDEASAASSEEPDDSPDNQDAGAVDAGTLRGRYILQEELGRGGVGIVYRARDLNRAALPAEHQYVALKVLREEQRADRMPWTRCAATTIRRSCSLIRES